MTLTSNDRAIKRLGWQLRQLGEDAFFRRMRFAELRFQRQAWDHFRKLARQKLSKARVILHRVCPHVAQPGALRLQLQRRLQQPDLGVDVKVVVTPPCILCMENH